MTTPRAGGLERFWGSRGALMENSNGAKHEALVVHAGLDVEGRFRLFGALLERWSDRSGEELEGALLSDLFEYLSVQVTPDWLARAAQERLSAWGMLPGGARRLLICVIPSVRDDSEVAYDLCLIEEGHVSEHIPASGNASYERLVRGFAHDVRNPLAAITSLSESVLMPGMDEDILEALGRIPDLVERVEGLLQGAVEFARQDHPSPGWHRLGFIVSRAIGALEEPSLIDARRVLSIEDTARPIYCDFDHAVTILAALLRNATEASGADVTLTVSHGATSPRATAVSMDETLLAIDVSDRGGGVAETIRHRIFEPFFSRKPGRDGLGLALARSLARANHGDVHLLESSSSGATFRALLPTRSEE